MKYLTFTVPCYNSQDYMKRCIDSLLVGGTDVEIIIIDDGSTDQTGAIADAYQARYPDIVKAVHQPNGGHGAGVNKGLSLATGIYFKVVDSDDWLDCDAYQKLLQQIKTFCSIQEADKSGNTPIPDLFVCNYIYDHLNEGTQKKISYENVFPTEKICNWNQIGHFRVSQYLIMHSLIFRTATLLESGVKLPEHMFYVDNLFACQPLYYVKSIYYMDLDLYHYFLGRDDQSVNEKVLIQRINQQIEVTKLVAQSADLAQIRKTYPKLERYLCRNISIMMAISSIHLLLIQTRAAQEQRADLWEELKNYNSALYYRLRFCTLSGFTYLPTKAGDHLTLWGYRTAQKLFMFQ